MKIEKNEVVIKYTRPDVPILITGIGDLHVGNAGFAEDYFIKTRNWIKKNNVRVILMGDLIDSIFVKDKRFELASLDPQFINPHDLERLIDAEVFHLKKLLEPIKENLIGTVQGNHESTIKKLDGRDINQEISEHFKILNLGYTGFIRFTFKRGKESRVKDLWYNHGAGASQTPGGKINKLTKMTQGFDADLFMMSHVHDLVTKRAVKFGLTKDFQGNLKLKEVNQGFMVCGSFLRTYVENHEGYGERKMYLPVKLGCATFEIDPIRDTIHLRE